MDEVRKAFEAWLREHRTSRGRNAGQSDSLRDTGVGVILWDAYAAGQREMRERLCKACAVAERAAQLAIAEYSRIVGGPPSLSARDAAVSIALDAALSAHGEDKAGEARRRCVDVCRRAAEKWEDPDLTDGGRYVIAERCRAAGRALLTAEAEEGGA